MGFCAGFACKKVGKVAAVIVGGQFIVFQVLAQYDYVHINWKKVSTRPPKVFSFCAELLYTEK